MKTFTIDAENNITAFGSAEEAAATTTTPFDSFSSQKELAQFAGAWPADRVVATWNSLTGVTPVERFKDRKTAINRIWKQIQGLGGGVEPSAQPAEPKATTKAKAGAQATKVASGKGKATKKATPAKKAAKGANRAKSAKPESGPREGTKTAQVVALLQRKNGATLEEIMEKMSWQKHTVRGFMAGAMKKAGFQVESFKSDKGERTYRISQ